MNIDDPPTISVPLDDVADLVNLWQEARDKARRARARVDTAEKELLSRLGTADVGTVAGQPAVCRFVESRPGIDLARLRTEHPDLWDAYPTVRERVRLRIPCHRLATDNTPEGSNE